MDFARKAQYFTLDVISNIAFGNAFGCLKNDADAYGYIETTEATLPVMIITTILPWLTDILTFPLLKGLMPSDKDLIGIGKVMG